MSSIAARIREVITARGTTERGLAKLAGFKTPTQVNSILKRLDEDPNAVELDTLARIADGAEVHLNWLLTGTGRRDRAAGPWEPTASERPVFRNLPGWAEAVAVARKKARHIPAYAFAAAGDTNALAVTDAVTPEMVIRTATMWLEVANQDELERLEGAAADAEIARLEREYDARLAKQKRDAAAPAEGETKPAKKPRGKKETKT